MAGSLRVFGYVLLSLLLPVSSVYAETDIPEEFNIDSVSVVVSEIQTGGLDTIGIEDGRQEFVELYNQTAEPIDITGWELQYFSASRTGIFEGTQTPTRTLYIFDGYLAGYGYMTISFHEYIENMDGYFGENSTASSGLLAKSGGHIRLVNSARQVTDVVGWGTAIDPEGDSLPAIMAGQSAKRIGNTEELQKLHDSNNNLNDFIIDGVLSPMTGGYVSLFVQPPEDERADNEEPEPEQEQTPGLCDNLQITEILPNPDGTDSGHEFIELFNPTSEDVYLKGCNLQTSANDNLYEFSENEVISAGAHLAFFDHTTGLTLANAAGGEVWLRGASTDYVATYPSNLGPDIAWALIDGAWQDTAMPTPNAINELPEIIEETEDEPELAPCPEGKFRNPETNRCKAIEGRPASLSPCKIGQIRNPDTNRCRNIATLASSLVPCRVGQERNPETNRCRNVLSANRSLQPCQEGYQRNPDTNRCRRIPAVLAASPSVGSTVNASPATNYSFLATITTLIAGYGLFEYRRDVANWLQQRKSKAAKTAK